MSLLTVMIVEDDPRASYALENAINQHNRFKVIAASERISESLADAMNHKPDLIMVDITLPDGSGLDLISRLKQSDLNASYIMTTAERESSVVSEAIQLGVMDYLVKPLRVSRIHQALDDFIAFKETIHKMKKVDQVEIDHLFRKNTASKSRRTPKGIDENTLGTLMEYINNTGDTSFTAQQAGDAVELSRITARRYLEYLEEQGIVEMNLDYNTGGRPKQHYKRNY
ncbi:response regulator [Marinomonas balearica]|uniref:Transcriptional regulatory protein n=1 Tax=Marinomonas balearica TaxID=491947 RepID=A0A4V3CH01_9GAMM|nr:response regulator [Marinomonas balearica]TDO99712.1 response regulator of citrate/malate metabolism [Marinomonas balearica]